jgi:hypothetical protein
MKKVIYISGLFSLLVIVSSFGCSNKKKISDASNAPANDSVKMVTVIEVIKNSEYTLPENNAAFTVNSHTIKGDILTLNISYSGGCQEHVFKGYFTGMFMKSMPPKANLLIEHNSNEDACREMITKDISFNVSAMRYGTKGPLMIQIAGYANNPIEYKY